MKKLFVIATLVLMLPSICFAGSLSEKYVETKARGDVKSIEVNAGYTGPEVRYLVKIKQYDPDTGAEKTTPREVYVIVEDLEAEKAVLQTLVDNTAHISSIDALKADCLAASGD